MTLTVQPERPVCNYCNIRKAKPRSELSKLGFVRYRNYCSWCGRNRKARHYEPKPYCELCGFVAIHMCQLDVDHIDGNHNNNCVTNLQTLCSNCHRLKTWLSEDWTKK